METLLEILEETQSNMDELSAHHAEQKDFESQKLILQESKELEVECQKVIEMAQSEILKPVATSTAVMPSADKVDMADKDLTEPAISLQKILPRMSRVVLIQVDQVKSLPRIRKWWLKLVQWWSTKKQNRSNIASTTNPFQPSEIPSPALRAEELLSTTD